MHAKVSKITLWCIRNVEFLEVAIYYIQSFLQTEVTIFSQKVFNQKIKQWNIRYRTNILVKTLLQN